MENPATERLLQENFTEYIEEEETTDESRNTAHRISQDPWYQAGFILITSMNSAYVLGYSGICMVPLGWVAGILGLIAAALISFYANYLLARLHQIEGVRHIRYRDLAGYIYGLNNPPRDYEIPGSKATKIFNSMSAATNMAFMYNTSMLSEIQGTVKRPYIRNMHKALYLQFLMGSVPMYAVIFAGYWAYGSSTSSYLLNSVNGPNWVKTLANASAFLQTVISLHIFASPTYECLDTKFARMNESIYSAHNWIVRLVTRGAYLIIATMVAAMFPFLGDFVTLTSAVSVIPLTFVLPNHMYIKVKGKDLNALHKSWHWVNVWFFSLLAIVGAVAALRSIVIDYKTYHLFADLSS